MKRFIEEFKSFALKGNMMDMAVGVIIGSSFSSIVTSLTDNFINPLLNFVTGGARYTWQDIASFISAFLSSLVNFIIMAFVLFCLLKIVNKITHHKEEVKEARKCPYCMGEVDPKAVKCPHCTSDLG